ncbi:hypothetical protein QYE76_063355 [Lolium multiflorum]|uniref:Uncharacterized protein n=1 Tax=Lolium multiflorum TaxID=4521 RepID=A0AAD8S5I8_LOLMU|nr:hypothetical protein QYE76_063355 [Lolium multiflorum]
MGSSTETVQQDAAHEGEMTEVNAAAIEACLVEISRATMEHEAARQADRHRLGDLVGWRSELIAVVKHAATSSCPRPSGWRTRATSHARLHARWDAELGVRAAAHTRDITSLMRDAKGHLRAAEAEHALSNVARSDRRRAATKDTTAGKKHVGGAGPSS